MIRVKVSHKNRFLSHDIQLTDYIEQISLMLTIYCKARKDNNLVIKEFVKEQKIIKMYKQVLKRNISHRR